MERLRRARAYELSWPTRGPVRRDPLPGRNLALLGSGSRKNPICVLLVGRWRPAAVNSLVGPKPDVGEPPRRLVSALSWSGPRAFPSEAVPTGASTYSSRAWTFVGGGTSAPKPLGLRKALRFTFSCSPADTLQETWRTSSRAEAHIEQSSRWSAWTPCTGPAPRPKSQVAVPSFPPAGASEETPCVPCETVAVQALGAC